MKIEFTPKERSVACALLAHCSEGVKDRETKRFLMKAANKFVGDRKLVSLKPREIGCIADLMNRAIEQGKDTAKYAEVSEVLKGALAKVLTRLSEAKNETA